MARNKELGAAGEALACEYLERKGFMVIDRNYSCKIGEIDIIALEGDTLAFVEVKTRSSDRFGTPSEAVSRGKQNKIVKTALLYMQQKCMFGYMCRFDIVEVGIDEEAGRHKLNLIRDAFQYSGKYGY